MELLCYENQLQDVTVLSQLDNNLLEDERVLSNMLHLERRWTLQHSYFDVQPHLKPEMRRVLTTWMAEVCEDQQCEDSILPLATILLDNFLSVRKVTKEKLQLVGCVCLFVASKLGQCFNFSADQLMYYSDYSITLQELLEWELILLQSLNWDIAAVTSNNFLDSLLARLPEMKQLPELKLHARIYIALSSTDYSFAFRNPSLIAVASLCVAAYRIGLELKVIEAIRAILLRITSHSQESLTSCISDIEALISSNLSDVQQASMCASKRPSSNCQQPTKTKESQDGSSQQPTTPTDILDVLL